MRVRDRPVGRWGIGRQTFVPRRITRSSWPCRNVARGLSTQCSIIANVCGAVFLDTLRHLGIQCPTIRQRGSATLIRANFWATDWESYDSRKLIELPVIATQPPSLLWMFLTKAACATIGTDPIFFFSAICRQLISPWNAVIAQSCVAYRSGVYCPDSILANYNADFDSGARL